MKIITLEGLDSSGKQTQLNLLYEYYKAKNYKVACSSFPRYGTKLGKLIKEGLNNPSVNKEYLHFRQPIFPLHNYRPE